EATLRLHARGDRDALPLHRMASTALPTLQARAQRLVAGARDVAGAQVRGSQMNSTIGGGSLPGESIPSHGLQVTLNSGRDPETLAQLLRTGARPVVGRIREASLLFDLRTVDEKDDDAILVALREAMATLEAHPSQAGPTA